MAEENRAVCLFVTNNIKPFNGSSILADQWHFDRQGGEEEKSRWFLDVIASHIHSVLISLDSLKFDKYSQ
jgi:hypothetical protein